MLPAIPREQQLGILRKMLMIRRAEEHCIRFHTEHEGLIRGHFHVYIGQEATGVAVCASLNADDYVFTRRTATTAMSSPKAAIRKKSSPRLSAAPPATARVEPGPFMSQRRTWASSTPRRSSAAVSPSRQEPLTRPR